jgi:hypothetical protein
MKLFTQHETNGQLSIEVIALVVVQVMQWCEKESVCSTYMGVKDFDFATGRVHNRGAYTALAHIPVSMEELEGITVQCKPLDHGAHNRVL